MRSRGWLLLLGALAFPTWAPAQTVKVADLLGGWQGELEHVGHNGKWPGWMVLWPDGLWWYTGPQINSNHGGARWRLVGDTLWLANDYEPYFHGPIELRINALSEKYDALGVIDMAIIRDRTPYPVPDSVYWSKAFRDSTTSCSLGGGTCPTWVYKVSMQDGQLHLVLLENLSWHPEWAAMNAVFKRDSLVGRNAYGPQ